MDKEYAHFFFRVPLLSAKNDKSSPHVALPGLIFQIPQSFSCPCEDFAQINAQYFLLQTLRRLKELNPTNYPKKLMDGNMFSLLIFCFVAIIKNHFYVNIVKTIVLFAHILFCGDH